jgi:hypothetical protein
MDYNFRVYYSYPFVYYSDLFVDNYQHMHHFLDNGPVFDLMSDLIQILADSHNNTGHLQHSAATLPLSEQKWSSAYRSPALSALQRQFDKGYQRIQIRAFFFNFATKKIIFTLRTITKSTKFKVFFCEQHKSTIFILQQRSRISMRCRRR